MLLSLVVLFGIVLGIMLIAFEDGVPFGLYRKISCKAGWHKTHVKVGSGKVNKYYCQHCKAPRRFPDLRVIDGGNKMATHTHKF
jgi:hypothetical protein